MAKLTFTVEIEADDADEADHAYEDMISAAIDISNSSATVHVLVFAPDTVDA